MVNLFSRDTRPSKSSSRPNYPPEIDEEIEKSVENLATYVPRKVAEQINKDIDESLVLGDTGISLTKLLRSPSKTIKKQLRYWTYVRFLNTAKANLKELIWKPRLDWLVDTKRLVKSDIRPTVSEDELGEIRSKVLDWVSAPTDTQKYKKFEGFETINEQGNVRYVKGVADYKDVIDPNVWAGFERQRSWDELARFRSNPTRYAWKSVFGEKHKGAYGTEGPLFKVTPQSWLGPKFKEVTGDLGAVKVVSGAQKALGKATDTTFKASKTALKGAAKAAKKVAVKVFGETAKKAISKLAGAAVGAFSGPVGAVAGALLIPVAEKITKIVAKLTCCSCGCLVTVLLMTFFGVVFTVGEAFRWIETGGPGSLEEAGYLQVSKTVEPSSLPKDGASHEVTYTINYLYSSEASGDATGVMLMDDYDESELRDLEGAADGNISGGVITWDLGTLSPGDSGSKSYRGSVVADDDKIISNFVTIRGTVDGEQFENTSSATLVIGKPQGLPPSGWPTRVGCLTQGPATNDSHKGGLQAIDISVPSPEPAGARGIYATHDGIVYIKDTPDTSVYGRHVILVSTTGEFRTLYGHLDTFAVSDGQTIGKGTLLGQMGNTGVSSGLHLHYEFRGNYQGTPLKMAPPFIPIEVPSCVSRGGCRAMMGEAACW